MGQERLIIARVIRGAYKLHRKEEVVMIIHVIEFSSSEMLNIILILEGYSNYSIV